VSQRLFYWDQRIAIHPDTGQMVATFWTHDGSSSTLLESHISWDAAVGRSWTLPAATGLPGHHTQPLALGGDRLLAVYPAGSPTAVSSPQSVMISAAAGSVMPTSLPIPARVPPSRGRAPTPRSTTPGVAWIAGASGTHAAFCSSGWWCSWSTTPGLMPPTTAPARAGRCWRWIEREPAARKLAPRSTRCYAKLIGNRSPSARRCCSR